MKELAEAVRKITEKRREESEQKITLAAGMNRMMMMMIKGKSGICCFGF